MRIAALLVAAAALLSARAWERRMSARAKALRAQYGMGSEPVLARRLVAMRNEDQQVRERWLNARGTPDEEKLTAEMARTDERLTGELKGIVEKSGWPTYETVGYDGASAAALIVIHSP